jgi:branched-chain amino acid transport system substrate-binding protein
VQKLISQDEVFAIIGGGCSNPTLAAKETLEKAKIPTVIHASTHDGITDPVAENIFAVATSSTIESTAQLDFALKQGAKKIAIISMRDAWGRARYTPLIEEMKKRGIEVVADEEMVPDANDATAQVLRLKATGADAVIVLLFPKPAAVFMRDSFKMGYKPLMIGQTGIADPAALEEQVGMPGATENFRTISMVRYVPQDEEVAKYREAIEAKFPGDRLSPFNLFGIGAAQVMINALKEAGPELTQEKVIEALANTKLDVDVYGAPITCSKTDHRCNKSPAWLQKAPGGETKVIDITVIE